MVSGGLHYYPNYAFCFPTAQFPCLSEKDNCYLSRSPQCSAVIVRCPRNYGRSVSPLVRLHLPKLPLYSLFGVEFSLHPLMLTLTYRNYATPPPSVSFSGKGPRCPPHLLFVEEGSVSIPRADPASPLNSRVTLPFEISTPGWAVKTAARNSSLGI